MDNKLTKNKLAQGILSLFLIIILLASMLAGSIYFQDNITANSIKETATNENQIRYFESVKELSQLSEGAYKIQSGYVVYADDSGAYAPLYIKVNRPLNLNGIFAVDKDGNIEFTEKPSISAAENTGIRDVEEKSVATTITGRVAGMEGMGGLDV